MSERDYLSGQRSGWLQILNICIRNLGYKVTEEQLAALIGEREDAIRVLRSVCETHGDNDWEDTLYLSDIIEKHLARNLESRTKQKVKL